jgi:arylsulfatase A-like enzyme
LGLAHRGFLMPDYDRHLLRTLKPAGWFAALYGVQHLAPANRDAILRLKGYDALLTTKKQLDGAEAIEFLRRSPPEPFFLAAGFFETHREFPQPGPGEDPRWSAPAPMVPDTPATRADFAAFRAAARLLDEKMGAVLSALEQSGLAERTLVVCTADHGPAFPGMKCCLTDGGLGVLLILRGPGFRGGKVVDALVSHLDVFPTLCEAAQLEPPPHLQGRSLFPLITGGKSELREELFAEINYHAAYEPLRAVRTRRWKYLRRYDGRSRPVLPNCDDSPSKDAWLAAGGGEAPPPPEALYDLALDPQECRNRISDPACAEDLNDLRARLARWMNETHDPLLDGGRIPVPASAVVNDPDGRSPREQTIPVGEFYGKRG